MEWITVPETTETDDDIIPLGCMLDCNLCIVNIW